MKYATSILALAVSASAHLILNYPKPYGNPNNSPLDNSGSDFPCKATSPAAYTVTTMNEWNAGETKQVSFTGSAVHGGGSCQFSLTTDKAPTKETQWKVIHSIIGGCPSNATGNLDPEDAEGHGAAVFDVTLPSTLPAGEYTFAWTWFNKRGNREMYMNCAPLKVGGGSTASTSDVSAALGSLPDMFVANLPRETCATTNEQDLVFPDPGESVEKGASMVPGTIAGPGCATMTKMGGGAGSMGSPPQATDGPAATNGPASSSAASQPTTTEAAPAASSTAGNPGGVFAPGASSPVPSAGPTGSPSPQPGNNGAGSGTPCTQEGAIVCIGSGQFGLCNQGFAVPQALAAGTTCSNGQISRRSVRFPRAALHRRHGSNMI